MRKQTLYIIYFFLLIGTINPGFAQENQNRLESHLAEALRLGYSESYIKGYTQPLATAFGTSMGGGIYHRAYIKSFPRFDAGISGVYVTVPDKNLEFLFNGNPVPTFFGTNTSSGTGIVGSGLNGYWLPQVHVNIGLFANLEIMGRGLKFKISEIGDIDMLGFGVKYGLSDLVSLPVFPLDLSVQGAYQTLSVDRWLSTGTFIMNLNVSKGFVIFPVDFYAGIGFESTSMTINTNEIPNIGEYAIGEISFEGENKLRVNFGISWTLYFLNIHADYNIGEYNSVAGGIMLAL